MDADGLEALLRAQHGVVARRQLAALGFADHDVARLVRRRDLTRLDRGVFVNHTGQPTQAQREAGAVLRCWPSALASFSALGLEGWRRGIHLMVPAERTVVAPRGVSVVRNSAFATQLREHPFPPHQQLEEAAVDAAASLSSPDRSFSLLADLLQTRRTTVDRLIVALERRERVARRASIAAALDSLGGGDFSVLEREWHRVERRHGLPPGHRQVGSDTSAGRVVRDVVYEDWKVVVELDGRAFHDSAAARDRDAARDLEAAGSGTLLTLRLTYGQVFREPCLTAERVGAVLATRGWRGAVKPCHDCSDRRFRSPCARNLRS